MTLSAFGKLEGFSVVSSTGTAGYGAGGTGGSSDRKDLTVGF
jgi:hypothetical protein